MGDNLNAGDQMFYDVVQSLEVFAHQFPPRREVLDVIATREPSTRISSLNGRESHCVLVLHGCSEEKRLVVQEGEPVAQKLDGALVLPDHEPGCLLHELIVVIGHTAGQVRCWSGRAQARRNDAERELPTDGGLLAPTNAVAHVVCPLRLER